MRFADYYGENTTAATVPMFCRTTKNEERKPMMYLMSENDVELPEEIGGVPFEGRTLLTEEQWQELHKRPDWRTSNLRASQFDGIALYDLIPPWISRPADEPPPMESLLNTPPPPKVIVTSEICGAWTNEGLCQLAEEILHPATKRQIKMRCLCAGRGSPNDDEHFFLVSFAGVPQTENSDDRPDFGVSIRDFADEVWGLELPSKTHPSHKMSDDERWTPIGDGRTIVAVADDRNLFIIPHVLSSGGDGVKMLRKIFEETVLVLQGKYHVSFGEKYATMCQDRELQAFSAVEVQIKTLEDRLNELRSSLREKMHELERAQREQLSLMNTTKRGVKAFMKEWRTILRCPHVVNARCFNKAILVYTDCLYVHTDTGNWYKLGKFLIIVDEEKGVRIRNLTDPKKTGGFRDYRMEAPHVFGYGKPCFGTLQKPVQEMLLRREYAALIQLLISFLQTANVVDSAGKYVTLWPVVSEEEATGKKPGKKRDKAVAAG